MRHFLVLVVFTVCISMSVELGTAGDPPKPDPCSDCYTETFFTKLCTNCHDKPGSRYSCIAKPDIKCDDYAPGTQCKAERIDTVCFGADGCCKEVSYPYFFLTCGREESGSPCHCMPIWLGNYYEGEECVS